MSDQLKFTGMIVGGEKSVSTPDTYDKGETYTAFDVHIPDHESGDKWLRLYTKKGTMIDQNIVDIQIDTSLGLVDRVNYIELTNGNQIKVAEYDLL